MLAALPVVQTGIKQVFPLVPAMPPDACPDEPENGANPWCNRESRQLNLVKLGKELQS
jgi:hypothetical protein